MGHRGIFMDRYTDMRQRSRLIGRATNKEIVKADRSRGSRMGSRTGK
jgi:hypothetical protein